MKLRLPALLALAALSIWSAAPARAGVMIGQPAPDFALPDPSGILHHLSDYKNDIVVLEWTNPQCPYVRKYYGTGAMQKLQLDAYRNYGVIWLRIDSSAPGQEGYLEPPAAAALIASDHSTQTAFLLDPDGKVGKLYGATNTPDMYVIDRQGILAYEGAIDDMPSADPATLENAHNYVREAIDDVQRNKPMATPVTEPYGCSVKYAQ
jgi:peroxiredoxin